MASDCSGPSASVSRTRLLNLRQCWYKYVFYQSFITRPGAENTPANMHGTEAHEYSPWVGWVKSFPNQNEKGVVSAGSMMDRTERAHEHNPRREYVRGVGEAERRACRVVVESVLQSGGY